MKKETKTSIVTFSIASFVAGVFLTYTLTSAYTSQLKKDTDQKKLLLMALKVDSKIKKSFINNNDKLYW